MSRPFAIFTSWFGPVAAVVTLCAAAWLTGEYLHAVWVTPADTARVRSLLEKAHTDNSVHRQLLQPEYDRQRNALQLRVRVYRSGGLVLVVALGSFLAWLRWFKPLPGSWVGLPGWLTQRADSLSTHPGATPAPPKPGSKKKVKGKGGGAAPYAGEPAWAPAVGSGRSPAVEIRIGTGACGIAAGAIDVGTAVHEAVTSLAGEASVKRVGCAGFCHAEPTLEVVEDGQTTLYARVTPADARRLVRRHVRPAGVLGRVREHLRDARGRLVDDAAWVSIEERKADVGQWLGGQVRVVLENCGRIDPLSLDDYRRHDGYRALATCLERWTPAELVEQVRRSGLGRRRANGATLAAAWDDFRAIPGSTPCLVCSADEGDPAAAMARTLLEGDPFRVLEGLAIAAYAVGARDGVLLVRRADKLAVDRVRAAAQAAEQEGLLGDGLLGGSFGFRLAILEGAGPAWCGDDDARIETLQAAAAIGGTVDLRARTPIVTDLEAASALPWIVRHGPESFAAVGTARSKGTRVVSLAGKIVRGGVVEVPVGMTVRAVVQDVGGGIPGGGPLKAVVAGGPFGVLVPSASADARLDGDLFQAAGGAMGTGSLVVLDGADCIAEFTRRTLRVIQKDACRSCSRYVVDGGRMLEVVERVCKGTAKPDELDGLIDLALRARDEATCAPGKAGPNVVLTALAWFREEFDAHVRDRRCPAAACRSLIHYTVHDACVGCTLCAQVCPLGAIEARPYSRHEIDHNRCTRCGLCVTTCVEHAIEAV
jgi:NADH-quinone oxidoreductase subunit F